MKKSGVVNAQLSGIIAGLGHMDRLVVCDSGLPIPHSAEQVDLALVRNVPRFLEALSAILGEMKVEGAVIADEMESVNPCIFTELKTLLQGIPITCVPHDTFKTLTRDNETNISFVRTGEITPYANVILVAGVTFP